MNVIQSIPWKHPKIWGPVLLAALALISLPLWMGDSLEDKHGRKPSDLPPLFRNAVFQRNGSLIKELATPEYAQELAEFYEISLAQGKQNNRSLPPNWILEEFQISEDHYLYHLQWINEVGRVGDFHRIRKINDEWKLQAVNPSEFDLETKGLTPRIIRGNAQ